MSYATLVEQFNKVHRHVRQGSITTRRRYYQAMLRFLEFVSEQFKLQNLKNVKNKHLAAYVRYLEENGCSPNYLRTELAAVRFYLDQIPTRYKITRDNAALGVPPRGTGCDRAWTEDEYRAMVETASEAQKEWIADALVLAWEMGLRIHEVMRLSRADAEDALRVGSLRVKGKGGLVRRVPLTPAAAAALARTMQRVPRGSKLFVGEGQKTHQVIAQVQNFIREHRPRQRRLTFHGTRYSYAQRNYAECTGRGMTRSEAEQDTARKLGHRRRRVTRWYVRMP
ncbi:MAG: tyrosine-type recombinase/integrase [Moorellales bacterium]